MSRLFDDLLGEFLAALEARGLTNQVVIVVTGDHGLRFRQEFESVAEPLQHGDVAFNVPFLVYAPGIFQRQVQLPYVTSHVDITPTLLELSGLHDDTWLHHGSNMLDQRLGDRVTFMMNTNLSPVDGFHWRGCHYVVNNVTGQVDAKPRLTRSASEPGTEPGCRARVTDKTARSLIERADRFFLATAAYFHQRRQDPLSSTGCKGRDGCP
jgi:phosphoglycerol transferase MdoB-like AlkP superfamily enzyme